MKRFFLGIFCAAGCLGAAENWPGWRGPEGTGAVAEGEIPSDFKVAWKVELPGPGCSTPAVSDGRIFLTAPVKGKDSVICYDLEGKEMWRHSFGEESAGRGKRAGGSANPSPVTDGERVYVYFKSGTVAALDYGGKEIWSTNLQKNYGPDKLWWDLGTSPVLVGGKLVVAVMQTDADSYVVALDPGTGEEVWKTGRNFKVGPESGDAYTTPHAVSVGGKPAVVSFGGDHLTAHAASDGKLVWTADGINPEVTKNWRTIASSVVTEGVIVVPHGRGTFLAGYDLESGGQLWRRETANTDAATPAARDGKVLLLADRGKDRGKVSLVEAKTGEVLWKEELPKGAGTYYSSPVWVADKAVFAREDGVVIVAEIGPKGFGKVTENKIDDTFIASPVAVGGMVFLRGERALWAVK